MSLKLNILACLVNKETAEELARILHNQDGLALRTRIGLPATGDSVEAGADVLLCELIEGDLNGLKALEAHLTTPHPGLAVYVIGNSHGHELLRRLMRLGVRDILSLPLEERELLPLFQRLVTEKRAQAGNDDPQHCGRVVSFFNTKGSSGATLLAVNTAVALAQEHKARVALMDFDLQFGSAALYLDIRPQRSILEALHDPARLDTVYVKALMSAHASGLHLLAAPGGVHSLTDVLAATARRLIEATLPGYDIIVLDLPRLITDWTLELLRLSDTAYLVTQNNLSAIRDTRQLLDFLLRNGLQGNKLEVINNRAMAKSPSASIEQLKATLNKPRLHRIRNDYEAAITAEDRGTSLLTSAPNSPLTQDIRHLAAQILAPGGATPATAVAPGLIDRLLRRRPAAAPGH